MHEACKILNRVLAICAVDLVKVEVFLDPEVFVVGYGEVSIEYCEVR